MGIIVRKFKENTHLSFISSYSIMSITDSRQKKKLVWFDRTTPLHLQSYFSVHCIPAHMHLRKSKKGKRTISDSFFGHSISSSRPRKYSFFSSSWFNSFKLVFKNATEDTANNNEIIFFGITDLLHCNEKECEEVVHTLVYQKLHWKLYFSLLYDTFNVIMSIISIV